MSLSFDSVMVFGFENSFILELLLLGSLSEGGGSGGLLGCCKGGTAPGDGMGLLPLGKAALAALVAARRLPPTVPLLYVRPFAERSCGLPVPLGLRLSPGPVVLMGVSPGFERFLSWI